VTRTRDCLDCGEKDGMILHNIAGTVPISRAWREGERHDRRRLRTSRVGAFAEILRCRGNAPWRPAGSALRRSTTWESSSMSELSEGAAVRALTIYHTETAGFEPTAVPFHVGSPYR